jgi:hypothetical protein
MILPSLFKTTSKCPTPMVTMGWTARALRRVEAEISESPTCLILPALERISILVCGLRKE